MKNRFYVTVCRFHTKAENKLLITGWFRENEIGENQLLVCLDRKKLHFTMEDFDLGKNTIKRRGGLVVTKQYHLWVDLPKSWRDCKCLEVKNFFHGVGNTAYSVNIPKLKRYEKKIPWHIDEAIAEQDGFWLSGWYIDRGEAKLQIFDPSGKEYPVEFEKKRRKDVRDAYPENTENEVVGFGMFCRCSVPEKIKIQLIDSGGKSEETLSLQPSILGKGVKYAARSVRKIQVYYQQFGAEATLLRAIDKITGSEQMQYKAWLKRQSPSEEVLNAQRNRKFAFSPKISIVVPLYKTHEQYLRELIESIKNQTYAEWELCLSDGSGPDSPLTQILKQYQAEDERIKVVSHDAALRIAENTNAALEIVSGDYIMFADHDDLLAPNALYECVDLLNEDPETEIIYTDEDKVDMNSKKYFEPHFKPDFNLDLLCSVNYICHLFMVKRDIYEKVGKLNAEFDGAQDYDFVLRCIEQTSRIRHIPKVLYHWRAHKGSTAKDMGTKKYAAEAGKRAIQAHYDRVGIDATVYEMEKEGFNFYRSKYNLKDTPLISVIIPNKDHIADLDKCIRSLDEKNAYQNMEYIIVENNSESEDTFAYYKKLEETNPKAKVVYWKEKIFNYPRINNFGAEHASGEYLLFLNNDTEVIKEESIEEMLGYCMREDVGAVGARLYFDDDTIQHAGVVVGLGGVAGHAFPGFPHDAVGYFGRIVTAQDYSAVTAACVMIKKAVFEEVDGFDEQFAVAFNDVDLCLKIRRAGHLIVYNPYAELMHYESKSRGQEDTEEKVKRFNSEIDLFRRKWREFLEQGDPYYSPNLTLDKCDFSLNVKKGV